MYNVWEIMLNENRRKIADYLKLYLILEVDLLKVPLEDFINEITDGGVTAIQLRNKSMTARENYEIGLRLISMLKDKDVLLVINDRVDMAKTLNCTNVHLGIKDIPAGIIKEIYPEWVVGYSCNDMNDINYANSINSNYIGVGPAFVTSTKKDLRGVIGSDGIKKLVKKANMPAVAIGGIGAENIELLSGIGLAGIAVSSAICGSKRPFEASKKLRLLVDEL